MEVWRGNVCIIGYVVWSSGPRFGARSQAKIDISTLVAKRQVGTAGADRRRIERRHPTAPQSLQAREAQSRQLGRSLEFIALGAVAATAAFILASAVGEVLNRPFAAIKASFMSANAHEAAAQCRDPDTRGEGDPTCPVRLP